MGSPQADYLATFLGCSQAAQFFAKTWLVAKICWPIIYVKCMQHFPADVAVLDEYYVYAQLQPMLLLIMADTERGKERKMG